VGLRVLQPGHIATLNLFEPAVATVLGVVVLHEELGALGWVGCLLVLVALALLGIADGRGDHDAVREQEVTA
jgi:DME family drug/metabolite transporter